MVSEALRESYVQHVQEQFTFTCKTLERLGYSCLYIAAGDHQSHFRDDTDFPFRLNPYFAQWLNLPEAANSFLLIDTNNSKPILFYYLPEDIWHKPSAIEDPAVLENFEVVNFSDPRELKPYLQASKSNAAYIGPEKSCVLDVACTINPEDLLHVVDYHRAYKSEYEQSCIRLANETAVIGHKAAADAFYRGESEYQIHMAFLQATRQLENEQPYSSIVALNENAAVLHYPSKCKSTPAQHRSFLIDAGYSVGGYASDISRTYAYQDNDFAMLILAMDELQRSLVQELKLGVSYQEVHLTSHRNIAELLIRFKLAKGSVEALLAEGVTSAFFPHGLGHYLGIQVHDKGGWLHDDKGDEIKPPQKHPYLRLTRTIEANQVFTIEPGLYFIEPLLQQARNDGRKALVDWTKVESFMPYGGVRIEDNIIVSNNGVINLTRQAGLS